MVLRAIRAYLAERRRATLADLANRFAIEESALRGMLAVWEAKGLVRITAAGNRPCGSCCTCPPEAEICEWIGGEGDDAASPRNRAPLPADAHRC